MKIKTILAIGLMVIFGQQSFAAAPTQQHVAQLLKVINIDAVFQETLKQIRPQMDQHAYMTVQTLVKRQQLNPQEQLVANELADKIYQQSLKMLSWDMMQPMYQQIYQQVYTAEEIQAQIDFYHSPTGQSILNKSPQVAQESMKIVNTRLAEIMKTSEHDFKQINAKLEQLKQSADQVQ